MKQKIEQLISQYKSANNLKLYSMIRKDKELVSWINQQISDTEYLPEQIYCIINDIKPFCKNGKRKKFNDFGNGYSMCGRNACQCWKENQSRKVSNAKNSMTTEDWDNVIEKRKETNLKKYGTEHVSQTTEFKEKIIKSNLEKYGVSTTLLEPKTQQKIKQTLLDNYGVDHPFKSKLLKNKAMNTCLEKHGHVVYPHSPKGHESVKKTMKEKYNTSSPSEMRYSQETRDFINDISAFVDEYHRTGINGICNKYPELKYEACRLRLIRYGVEEVIDYTKEESFIKDFLKKHDIDFIFNTRKIISPLELDFYIPSHNLAIEVCGLYWHRHARLKNRNYHIEKLNKCLAQNIQLLTIFSDHIEETPELVLNRLRAKLKLVKRTYHARNLKIISNAPLTKMRDFLNNNHLQGTKLGKINLAAIDENDEIVSVMTFGSLRTSLGQKNKINDHYEMYRFATNGNIPGVASKMFKYFVDNFFPQSVISYSDRNWGEGELYLKLGFEKSKITQPDYWYSKDFRQKKHRYNFTKHSLVKKGYDEKLTEFQIMKSLGYDRIYDCGNVKYLWIKK